MKALVDTNRLYFHCINLKALLKTVTVPYLLFCLSSRRLSRCIASHAWIALKSVDSSIGGDVALHRADLDQSDAGAAFVLGALYEPTAF